MKVSTWSISQNQFFVNSIQTNMDRLSAIYRDDPQTPIERVVYWMEFIVRHGGVKHLRSAANDLNFFQYHLIDVIAVLIIGLIVCVFVTFKVIKILCKGVMKYLFGFYSSAGQDKPKCD